MKNVFDRVRKVSITATTLLVLGFTCVLLLVGCTDSDANPIVGHWSCYSNVADNRELLADEDITLDLEEDGTGSFVVIEDGAMDEIGATWKEEDGVYNVVIEDKSDNFKLDLKGEIKEDKLHLKDSGDVDFSMDFDKEW